MEDKRCPVFVDGKECDRPLTLVDLEAEKIARYDLATYQCSLGHRSYKLLEPRSKARPSDMAREAIEQRMDELAREYYEPHDSDIPEEIWSLARQLKELDHS